MLAKLIFNAAIYKTCDAQRSGAGEGESLSVSTERTAGRWQDEEFILKYNGRE